MTRLVCFGVRETEVPFFNKINEKFGYELKLVTESMNDDNVHEAFGYEAVMIRGFCAATRRNIELLKENGLKHIVTRAAGFNNIDLQALKDCGLECARVPGYSPNAISELALTHAMMLLRHTAYTINRTREKNFTVDSTMFSREVRNCTVGILGTGKIGLTTAKLFKGLGARVLGYDIFQSDTAKEVVEFKSMDEILKESDIISVHMPFFKDSNYHIINDEFIGKMKEGAILVNTARGELQDLEAVIKGIESGRLGGFATDVLEGEHGTFFYDLRGETLENPVFEKLVNLYPKVLVTPHIGSYTDEALTNMIEISYENLKEYITTGTCKNKIA